MEENLSEEKKFTLRGEIILLIAVIINSMGVVLMLYSNSGISAISSVPFAFSKVLPQLSLGTWTYIFQGILVLSLMFLQKRFIPQYLFSFVVGFFFGKLIDINNLWVHILPKTLSMQVIYFLISYLLISLGIALSNRCHMPIVPTDLFPRELAYITNISYAKIKVAFDIICLTITIVMTFIFLGQIEGLGIGTILSALTMGKAIGMIGKNLDQRTRFVSFLTESY